MLIDLLVFHLYFLLKTSFDNAFIKRFVKKEHIAIGNGGKSREIGLKYVSGLLKDINMG